METQPLWNISGEESDGNIKNGKGKTILRMPYPKGMSQDINRFRKEMPMVTVIN